MEDEEILKRMVGTKGLEDLKTICMLFPSNNSYRNPFLLACHYIWAGIEKSKQIIQEEIIYGSEKENATPT